MQLYAEINLVCLNKYINSKYFIFKVSQQPNLTSKSCPGNTLTAFTSLSLEENNNDSGHKDGYENDTHLQAGAGHAQSSACGGCMPVMIKSNHKPEVSS